MANKRIIIIIIFVVLLIIIISGVIGYLLYRRNKETSDPCTANPSGSDANGNPCTPPPPTQPPTQPPASCVGLTNTAPCYQCMVSPANRPTNCPDCTANPSDPTCNIDCTMRPNSNCPDCATYPDAPGCSSTPSNATVLKQLQNTWGTLSVQDQCMTVLATINKRGYPNITDSTKITLAPCSSSISNSQIWKSNANNQFILQDSDYKHCLDSAGHSANVNSTLNMYTCDNTSNVKQSFTPLVSSQNPGQFQLQNRLQPSNCIDGTAAVGQDITLQACEPSITGQFWTFTPMGSN